MPIDKKLRNDILLVGGLLAAAAAAFAAIQLTKTAGGYAVLVQDGRETAAYPLSEEITVKIPSSVGGYNTLVISEGKADIVDADCPDKLCVHQHSVSHNGETIVCLPNKLVVKIVSESEADVDVVV